MTSIPDDTAHILSTDGLQALIVALEGHGYQVIGPREEDGAVVYRPVSRLADLPRGRSDTQGPGHYRLQATGGDALFGYTLSPQSWKRYLLPPEQVLWQARRHGRGFLTETPAADPARALLGVRPCELHAIRVQDRVLTAGPFKDGAYAGRRADSFVVAVNCTTAADTCFCTSMGGDPQAGEGFDLVLTEILEDDRHAFLVRAGSEAGAAVLKGLADARPATETDHATADQGVARAREQQGRKLDTDGLPELLRRNLEHPRWDEVAQRCLACGNCTSVCPTCFCTTVEDTTDLAGQTTERRRLLDSCFTGTFSYIHGGNVRQSIRARYRQWLTHKLSSWVEQFNELGCVGCGRCITWCPVGIDITEESAAIRASDGAGAVTAAE